MTQGQIQAAFARGEISSAEAARLTQENLRRWHLPRGERVAWLLLFCAHCLFLGWVGRIIWEAHK